MGRSVDNCGATPKVAYTQLVWHGSDCGWRSHSWCIKVEFSVHTLYLHLSKTVGFASTSSCLRRLRHAPICPYRHPSHAQTHVALCSIIYDRGVPSRPPSLAGAVQVGARQAVSFILCCCISCHCLSFVCSVVHDVTVKPSSRASLTSVIITKQLRAVLMYCSHQLGCAESRQKSQACKS